jgi:hypothetical protein
MTHGMIRRPVVVVTFTLALLACAAPATPPPSIVAIAELLKPAGVSMELMKPARLSGRECSQDEAVATARAAHAGRPPGEPEPMIGHVELYAAAVSVVARPVRGVPGGSHVAWLVALADSQATELVIVDADTCAVVAYDASPSARDFLP